MALLCVAILGLAFFHGGASPGARLVGYSAALAAFGLVGLGSSLQQSLQSARGPLTGLLGLAVLGLVQSIALPAPVTKLLAPERVGLAQEAGEVAGVAVSRWVPVSLTPSISFQSALELACLAAAVVAGGQAFRRRRRRRWLVTTAIVAALVQIVVGAGPLLAKEVPRLRGSYANSDHVALLLEIGAALCLAAVLWSASTRRWPRASEQRVLWLSGLGLLLVVLVLGVALTGSRAALAALAFGFAVELSLAARGRGFKRALLAGIVAIVLVAGFLGSIGIDRTLGRLVGTSWYDAASSARIEVWRDSALLIGRSPVLGTGLGSFREAYGLVQSSPSTRVTWAKAHNDYLEMFVCGGLLGGAILMLALLWTARALWARLAEASSLEDRFFVVGVFGVTSAVALHEFVDFGLTLPANGLLLATLMGAALAPPRQKRVGLKRPLLAGRAEQSTAFVDQLHGRELERGRELEPQDRSLFDDMKSLELSVDSHFEGCSAVPDVVEAQVESFERRLGQKIPPLTLRASVPLR